MSILKSLGVKSFAVFDNSKNSKLGAALSVALVAAAGMLSPTAEAGSFIPEFSDTTNTVIQVLEVGSSVAAVAGAAPLVGAWVAYNQVNDTIDYVQERDKRVYDESLSDAEVRIAVLKFKYKNEALAADREKRKLLSPEDFAADQQRMLDSYNSGYTNYHSDRYEYELENADKFDSVEPWIKAITEQENAWTKAYADNPDGDFRQKDFSVDMASFIDKNKANSSVEDLCKAFEGNSIKCNKNNISELMGIKEKTYNSELSI